MNRSIKWITRLSVVYLVLFTIGCTNEILSRAVRANLASLITDVVSESVDAAINP